MRNTILFSVLLFATVIAASVYYFSNLNKDNAQDMKPLKLIPSDAILITSFKNDVATDNVFKDYEVFKAILGTQEYSQMTALKANILRNPSFSSNLDKSDVYLSFHVEHDSLAYLYVLPTSDNIDGSKVGSLISSLEKEYEVDKIDTLGQSFYKLLSKNSDGILYIGSQSSSFIASSSKALLISVFDKNVPKISDAQLNYFLDKKKSNLPFSAFFINSSFRNVFSHFTKVKPGEISRLFDDTSGQTAFNINFKTDALILTGESSLEQGDTSYMALFANQNKKTQRLYRYLPSDAAIYVEYTLSDKEGFRNQWQRLLDKRKEGTDLRENLKSVLEFYELTSGEFMTSEMANEVGLGFLGLTSPDSSFRDSLSKYADRVGDGIFRFRDSDLLYAIYGDAFKSFKRPYFMINEDVLVLANSLNALNRYRQIVSKKDFLITTIGFKNAERKQGRESNVTVFIQTKSAKLAFKNTLKPRYLKKFLSVKDYGFQDFYSWSIQFSGNKGSYVTNVYGIYKASTSLGSTPSWTYDLSSRVATRPYVFQQSDTSEFIFFQEQDHTVHAITPKGQKLWSSVFSGRVSGDVLQLGDRSLVLVTDRNRLYRFAPDGKAYNGFSAPLSSPPSGTPLVTTLGTDSVIVVPLKNELGLFTMRGQKYSAWNPKTFDSTLLDGIFKDGEYLVVGSTSGTVYWLAEDGAIAHKQSADSSDVRFVDAMTQTQSSGKSVYTAVDNNGNVYRIDREQSKSIYKLSLREDESIKGIKFNTSDAESARNLVAVTDRRLIVADLNADLSERYSYDFNKEINRKSILFRDANQQNLIGISSQSDGVIYLFNEAGGLVEGFPIEARDLFFYGKIDYNTGNFLLINKRNDHKLRAYQD